MMALMGTLLQLWNWNTDIGERLRAIILAKLHFIREVGLLPYMYDVYPYSMLMINLSLTLTTAANRTLMLFLFKNVNLWMKIY